MTKDLFDVLMPIISADLVAMIADKRLVSENEAIELLYTSKLYGVLEDEETKVWQYSTPMLYSLLEQEWNSGTICFPDV